MAIHYQNYKRFSAGQGYAGVLCRGLGAQASSKRWVAVDCQNCRDKIDGVEVISNQGERGTIENVDYRGVEILIYGQNGTLVQRRVSWDEVDMDWAPLGAVLKAVFHA